MRIISFSRKWDKLNNPLIFTTFRYPRRDKDWEVEEVVQVVFKTRSPEREALGIARIIRIENKNTTKKWWEFRYRRDAKDDPECIIPPEAADDGFTHMGLGDVRKLLDWLRESAGIRFYREPIVHKLTLYWIERVNA